MISVIIPVYQCEKYLSRCLESVLNQTYKELEIILIDDGSKDDSGVICDKYAEKDGRIRVIHKQNEGVAVARNTGLNIAEGDYIVFVDSDDYIEPCMYQKMISVAGKYNCDVVMCDCVKDSVSGSSPYTHDIRSGYYSLKQLKEEYYPHLLMMENVEYPATISNCVMLIKNNPNLPRYVEGVRFSEDLLFGAQVLYKAKSFYYMKGENYYHYYMNDSSATHTFRKDKWTDYKLLYRESEKFFLNCKDYDFREQLDKMLLFLVYNSVGNISGAKELSKNEKKSHIKEILNTGKVREMFKRLSVHKLPVSWKLKIYTYIYKYKCVNLYLLLGKLT